MRRSLLCITCCAALAGCASAPRPAPATAPKAAAASAPATARPEAATRVSFGLVHAEQWDELARDAMPRLRAWTPDSVIGNRVTGAVFAFAGVPASLGAVADVAEGIRDRMSDVEASVVFGAADRSRASFVFVTKTRHGKVAVVRLAGAQHALVVGDWPAEADAASLEDFDAAMKSIKAEPAE